MTPEGRASLERCKSSSASTSPLVNRRMPAAERQQQHTAAPFCALPPAATAHARQGLAGAPSPPRRTPGAAAPQAAASVLWLWLPPHPASRPSRWRLAASCGRAPAAAPPQCGAPCTAVAMAVAALRSSAGGRGAAAGPLACSMRIFVASADGPVGGMNKQTFISSSVHAGGPRWPMARCA